MSLRNRLPFDPSPDVLALAAKDVLRMARFGLRMARDLAPAPEQASIPGAGLALRLADEAAGLASAVANRVLTPPAARASGSPLPLPADSLARAGGGEATATVFADSAYRALRLILTRYGAEDALVSELALREAYADALPGSAPADFAAALARAIAARRAVAEVRMPPGLSEAAAEEAGALAPLAFALSLLACTQEECDEARAGAILLASADLCLSLAPEARGAAADAGRLAAFLARYAPHV